MYIVYNSLCRSISQRNGGNVVFSAAIIDIIVLLYKDNVSHNVIFMQKCEPIPNEYRVQILLWSVEGCERAKILVDSAVL